MIENFGIGAMLHILGGGSEHSASEYYGLMVMAAVIDDNRLSLTFNDGRVIQIWDHGQSCCESRYLTTDDDMAALIGGRLTRIETKDGPTIDADYYTHEQVFVEIATDRGFVTLVNHNEHNGYYGGFGLTITETHAKKMEA